MQQSWDDLISIVRRSFIASDLNPKTTIKFVFDNGRNVWVRPTSEPEIESDSDQHADLELRMTFDDAIKILNRQLGPKKAIMLGRLRTKGDMTLAFRVAALFSKPLQH